MGDVLLFLTDLSPQRGPPGGTPDFGKNAVEPLFRHSDLRLDILFFPDAPLKVDVQPVEPPNQIEKLYDLGPEVTELSVAGRVVRQGAKQFGDPQPVRPVDDRNKEECGNQQSEPRVHFDVHRRRPQTKSEKEHQYMPQLVSHGPPVTSVGLPCQCFSPLIPANNPHVRELSTLLGDNASRQK